MLTTIDWLKKLIAFDTTSRQSNLALINCLANACADYHLTPLLIPDPLQPKANLLVTIPGQNGQMQGGVIFSGHTDVVPVDGQTWQSDPFAAVVTYDKVYGRGACDMKGFIAVLMGLIPRLQAQRYPFPIHLAFSYDEEIGCQGVTYLLEQIQQRHYAPKACIVGEPTLMHPIIGHKGIRNYRCQLQGIAAHSSLPTQGCNAIEYAAKMIVFLQELAAHYQKQGNRDQAFDIPYTTLSTNLIQGGNALNTIAEHCEFSFEFRNLVIDSADRIHAKIETYLQTQLLPLMQQQQPDSAINLEIMADVPGLDMSTTAPLVQAAHTICGKNMPLSKVAYATEAGLFQQAHIPTIVCGPGSIEQAHRANEFVTIAQLQHCEQFILQFLQSAFVNT